MVAWWRADLDRAVPVMADEVSVSTGSPDGRNCWQGCLTKLLGRDYAGVAIYL